MILNLHIYRKEAFGLLDILIKLAGYYEERWQSKIEELAEENEYPFSGWFGGEDRIYIPLFTNDEMDPNAQRIIDALQKHHPDKCQNINTIEGYCYKGNNKYKIPKLINSAKMNELKRLHNEKIKAESEEDVEELEYLTNEIQETTNYWNDLLKIFTSSPIRISNKDKAANKLVVISQNPHDIAQMSTGRKWTSCMKLPSDIKDDGGENYKKLFCEVQSGGLIAYIINENDKDIKDPLARVHIRRFLDLNGKNFAIPEDRIYGYKTPKFLQIVNEWLQAKQGAIPVGIYELQGGQYSDKHGDGSQENKLITSVLPKQEEKLIEWLSAPHDVSGVVVDYYVVTDLIRAEDPEIFELESDEGFLSQYIGNWPTKKTFANEDEANLYAERMNNDDMVSERIWDIERRCEEDQKNMGYCEYSDYLDDDFVTFEVTRGTNNRSEIIRQAVVNKVANASPGLFSNKMIDIVASKLMPPKATIIEGRRAFIRNYAPYYPEMIRHIDFESYNWETLSVSKMLYDALPDESDEQNRVKKYLTDNSIGYLESRKYYFATLPDPDHASANVLRPRLDGLSAVKNLNEESVDKLINLYYSMSSELGYNEKAWLRGSVLAALKGSKSDSLVKMYSKLISEDPDLVRGGMLVLPLIGRNLSTLGEYGEAFLPFLKEQIKVGDEEFQQSIMYIIDSIESGKGWSSKYTFNS